MLEKNILPQINQIIVLQESLRESGINVKTGKEERDRVMELMR